MSKIISNFYLIKVGGKPSYVGYTNRPIETRFKEHMRDKDFGDELVELENLGKLEYDFTWNEELINQYAREVSARETELILEYGTQDSIWQKGLGVTLGGQTWSNVKNFVRTNRDSPKFRGLSEESIIELIEYQRKMVAYLKNIITNTNPPEDTRLKSVIKHTKPLEYTRLKNVINHTIPPEDTRLKNVITGTKPLEYTRLKSSIKNTKPPEDTRLKSVIYSTKHPEDTRLKNVIRVTKPPEYTRLKNAINNTKPPEDIRLKHVVNNTKPSEDTRLKNAIRNTAVMVENKKEEI